MAKKSTTSNTSPPKQPLSTEKSSDSTTSPVVEPAAKELSEKEEMATEVEKVKEQPPVTKSEPEKDEASEKEATIEVLAPTSPAAAKPAPDPLRDLLAEDLRDTLLEKAPESMRAKLLEQVKDDPILEQIKFVKRWLKVQPVPAMAGQLPAPGMDAKPAPLFERNQKSPYEYKNGKWSYIG